MGILVEFNLWFPLYVVGITALVGIGSVAAGILYQYFTFNSCPAGTRPLPTPNGRLPLVGHRHLLTPVPTDSAQDLTSRKH